jgi:hypothetical protein
MPGLDRVLVSSESGSFRPAGSTPAYGSAVAAFLHRQQAVWGTRFSARLFSWDSSPRLIRFALRANVPPMPR